MSRLRKVSRVLMPILLLAIVGCDLSDQQTESTKIPVTKILVISDSMGTGYEIATPFPDRIANAMQVEVINYSENGRLTSQVMGQIPGWLDQHRASHLLVLMGTNDARKDQVEIAISNLQSIVDLANQIEILPIIATIPVYLKSQSIDERTALISEGVRNIKGNVQIADVRLALGDGSTTIEDGIHPNDDGQIIIAEMFRALM